MYIAFISHGINGKKKLSTFPADSERKNGTEGTKWIILLQYLKGIEIYLLCLRRYSAFTSERRSNGVCTFLESRFKKIVNLHKV